MRSEANRSVPESVFGSAILSASLAGLMVAELIGIGIYARYRLQRLLNPEVLADRAEQAIKQNYPDLRAEVIKEARSMSPEVAKQLGQDILNNSDEARQELEKLTARQIDRALEDLIELSADEFRQLLRDHHDTIDSAFVEIEQTPEKTERVILRTETELEQQLGIDVQRQARHVLRLQRALNDKLQRLQGPVEELTAEELVERRIVRILKAMEEQAEPQLRSRVSGPGA